MNARAGAVRGRKATMKATERTAIYAEWRGGTTIAELARKYRHWRKTIEDALQDESNATIMAQNACIEQANTEAKAFFTCGFDEVTELRAKLIELNRFVLTERYGKEVAEQWAAQHSEEIDALWAKMKAIAFNRGIPRGVYDDTGLMLDIVPWQQLTKHPRGLTPCDPWD